MRHPAPNSVCRRTRGRRRRRGQAAAAAAAHAAGGSGGLPVRCLRHYDWCAAAVMRWAGWAFDTALVPAQPHCSSNAMFCDRACMPQTHPKFPIVALINPHGLAPPSMPHDLSCNRSASPQMKRAVNGGKPLIISRLPAASEPAAGSCIRVSVGEEGVLVSPALPLCFLSCIMPV